MKKFLSMLAIAGVMVACNSGDDEVNGVDTSSQAYKDSVAAANAANNPTPVVVVNADSIRKADSARVADSLKNLKK
jgi:hypothetical protein